MVGLDVELLLVTRVPWLGLGKEGAAFGEGGAARVGDCGDADVDGVSELTAFQRELMAEYNEVPIGVS